MYNHITTVGLLKTFILCSEHELQLHASFATQLLSVEYGGPVVQFSILCSIPDSEFSIPILFLRFSILHFRFTFSILYS